MGYFVGQVLKASDGKANPGEVNRLLQKRLDKIATSDRSTSSSPGHREEGPLRTFYADELGFGPHPNTIGIMVLKRGSAKGCISANKRISGTLSFTCAKRRRSRSRIRSCGARHARYVARIQSAVRDRLRSHAVDAGPPENELNWKFRETDEGSFRFLTVNSCGERLSASDAVGLNSEEYRCD